MASLPILRHTKGVVFVRSISGGLTISSGQVLLPDGTSALPSLSFTSATGTGLRNRSGILCISVAGTAEAEWFTSGVELKAASKIYWSGTSDPSASDTLNIGRAATGVLGINQDSTHGVQLNVATDGTMQVLTRAGADSATIKAANADFTTSTTIRTALYSAASGTADTGWLRLANGDGFYWRNAAGSGNIRGLKVDSVNRVIVGDSNNAEVLIYPGSTAMVKFDGTTASQPALKVSGASLKVRLADDSADADIYAAQLLTSNTTYVLRTTAALANSAAANTATLTNAPTAGNPTKWVAINDNGTVRYMPLW